MNKANWAKQLILMLLQGNQTDFLLNLHCVFMRRLFNSHSSRKPHRHNQGCPNKPIPILTFLQVFQIFGSKVAFKGFAPAWYAT